MSSSGWSAKRLFVAIAVWAITVAVFLAWYVFRLFDTGSGIVALGATILSFALNLGVPPAVLLALWLLYRRVSRGRRHAV